MKLHCLNIKLYFFSSWFIIKDWSDCKIVVKKIPKNSTFANWFCWKSFWFKFQNPEEQKANSHCNCQSHPKNVQEAQSDFITGSQPAQQQPWVPPLAHSSVSCRAHGDTLPKLWSPLLKSHGENLEPFLSVPIYCPVKEKGCLCV